MKQTATVTIAAVCLVLAGLLLRSCGYRAGEHDQALRAAGVATDRHRAELVGHIVMLEAQVRRDSVQYQARVAQLQINLRSTLLHADSLEALARPHADTTILAVFDAFHRVIDSLQALHHADSLQTLFWMATAATRAAQRDSALAIADTLTSQRDAWKKRAEHPLGCTIGPSGTAGLAGAGIFTKSAVGWGASVGLGVTCGLRLS